MIPKNIFSKSLVNPKESEKDTEKYLHSQSVAIKGFTFKWTSPQRAGVPDRICIYWPGLVYFVEVKSEGEKPTELQTKIHKLLKRLGIHVYVVDTKAAVNDFINIVKHDREKRNVNRTDS